MLRIGDDDVFGSEVNAASRLGEDIARTGDILVTRSVRDKAADFPGVRFEQVELTEGAPWEAYRTICRKD